MIKKHEIILLLNKFADNIGHGEDVITESQFEAVADDLIEALGQFERVVRQGIPQPVREPLDISWVWKEKNYYISANGKTVFVTDEDYKRDMFIAELRWRTSA